MSIVANEGKDVLVSYNYMLRVEGLYDLPCKLVHSFKKANAFEYVQEGGLNDYVHMLRKPIGEHFSFTVERYVGTDPYPVLPLGAELVLPVILMISPHPNRFDVSKRTFVFTGCTVMNKTYGELNAEKSGILTETIEIGYREMVEVTIPMSTGGDTAKRWAFGKDAEEFEGNKKMSAVHNPMNKDKERAVARHWDIKTDQGYRYMEKIDAEIKAKTRAALTEQENNEINEKFFSGKKSNWKTSAFHNENNLDDKRANVRKWETSGDNKLGGGTVSATRNPNKLDDKRAKVRKWETAGDNKLGEGEVSARSNGVDSLRATPRKWEKKQGDEKLGGGEVSARSNGDLDAARAKARQWDIQTHIEKKNKPVLSMMRSIVDRMLEKEDNSKEWKASARVNENNLDAARATTRRWEISGDNKLGGGTASAKPNGVDSLRATPRKWETAGDNKLGGGKVSAQFNGVDDLRATPRKWETAGDNKLGEGEVSARSNGVDSLRMTARKWETTNDNKLGGGKASAKQGPSSKAENRKWTIKKEESNQSAVTEKDTKAKMRKWEFSENNKKGAGKASAKQSPSTKAEGRKWPAVSSAKKRQE